MNRRITWASPALLLARLMFGSLFLIAALEKILDPERFVQQVAKYDIIGPDASALVGTVLPWAEFLVGSCLLAGMWIGGTWLFAVVVFGCFTAARASVLHRGLSLECGCGIVDEKITVQSTMIVGGLFEMSLVCFIATIRISRRVGAYCHSPRREAAQRSARPDGLKAEVLPCL